MQSTVIKFFSNAKPDLEPSPNQQQLEYVTDKETRLTAYYKIVQLVLCLSLTPVSWNLTLGANIN